MHWNYLQTGKKNLQKTEDGFTLIEILVVILIVGILASIAVPVFLNQRKKANDATVQSDIRNAITVTETYFSNNPTAVRVHLPTIQGMMSKDPSVRLTWTGNHNDYCIEGRHSNGDAYRNNWTYSSVTGKTAQGSQNSYSCSSYGADPNGTHVAWNPTS